MNSTEFNALKDAQVERLNNTIDLRNAGNSDDLLHNIKKSADLQGITFREAVAGYMADRTVMLYDMMRDENVWAMDVWESRISDQMADLVMLNAIIKEEDLERKGLNDMDAITNPVPPDPDRAEDFVPEVDLHDSVR